MMRAYIKTNLIDNNRLKMQVLEDPFLNFRTKLGILEAYKRFVMGLDNPNSLKRWHWNDRARLYLTERESILLALIITPVYGEMAQN